MPRPRKRSPATTRGRAVAIGSLAAVALLGWGLLSAASEFDLSRYETREIAFRSGGATLRGTLALPRGATDPPVALLVAGDGPQPRFEGCGLMPLANALLDAGVGVASWDKPGTGGSGGDWLAQSMADRSEEVRAAVAAVRGAPGVGPVGVVGFSQAGWMLPRVAADTPLAFTALVGAAVSWQRQGDYYSRRRRLAEGMPPVEIEAAIARDAARDDALFAGDTPPEGMSAARFGFVRRNRHADSSAELPAMRGPVLALWGAADENVEPGPNAAAHRAALPCARVEILPRATHGVLRAGLFPGQITAEWPGRRTALFTAMGRRAYAPGAIRALADFALHPGAPCP
jgi:dienelactone hydrolase